MPVTFKCPHCGRTLLVHDELGMKGRRCSGCRQMVEVPAKLESVISQTAPAEVMSPLSAIESGHLEYFAEFLAEKHHTPQQRKIDAGKVWGVFVMSPAEVVDFARDYQGKFDVFVEESVFPNGRGLCVLLHPVRRDRGCLCLTGLVLPTNLTAWSSEHGSIPLQELRIEKSPMDGRPVQLNFIGTVRKDAPRPSLPKVSADGISMVFRERLYTFGWNRQEVELMYFGVRSGDLSAKAATGVVGPTTSKRVLRSPRELALLQRIYACRTGARQVEDAEGGVSAVLAAPVSSRVFAADVTDLLTQYNDALLCGTFGGLDMNSIPLNDSCDKYYRREEGQFSALVGTDPRMITLAFTLAALAEAGRTAPAEALAQKVVPRFTEKCRRGSSHDKNDEWYIGRWGKAYYTVAAAILMKEKVEHYTWALPLLDAVVIEYHHAEEPLYWRALAAYRYWLLKPERPNRIQMAQQRLHSVISSAQKEPIDPARLETIRQYLAKMGGTH
ncbi:MAG: hypothetical protein ABSA67_01910 [Candidatus Brocadiia bacterium]